MAEQDNSQGKTFFLNRKVYKRIYKTKNPTLKDRIRTLIKSKGMSEADFYNSLGLTKQYWYCISWGIWDCTLELKVKIATSLGVDSSVIFGDIKSPDFVTADKYHIDESQNKLNEGEVK
ncbi:MAG: helix-turn-helix transcriptional regulator [Candidatus Pacearchaeota archaeon]|jgi:hypothetical protein